MWNFCIKVHSMLWTSKLVSVQLKRSRLSCFKMDKCCVKSVPPSRRQVPNCHTQVHWAFHRPSKRPFKSFSASPAPSYPTFRRFPPHIHILLCSILFQYTDLHKDAASFAKKLIASAANFKLAQNSRLKTDTHHFKSGFNDSFLNHSFNTLVAYFAKTSFPSWHHHSSRFCQTCFEHPYYSQIRGHHCCQPTDMRFRNSQLLDPLRNTSQDEILCLKCWPTLLSKTVSYALSTNSN